MGVIGNFEKGNVLLEKALHNASKLNDILILGPVEYAYGDFLHCKGEWEQSLEHFRKCIEYCAAAKYHWITALSQTCSGIAYAMIGDAKSAQTNAEKGLELHRTTGVGMHLPSSYWFSSFTHFELGDLQTARNLAEEALRLSKISNEKVAEGRSMILLGRILGIAAPTQTDEAAECILEGIRILDELRARALYSLGYLFLGEVYLNANMIESARENLVKAETMF
jgi:tetratricopeptide (TPR) repeat protein